jgi:N utilization substance protein B
MGRSMARQAAMQLLYERMSGGEADEQSLDLVYEQLTIAQSEPAGKLMPTREDREYIQDVLEGVRGHQEELDSAIAAHSSGEWQLSRLPYVDLSILRLSAYELLYRSDIPNNVAISEAMELANLYSEPKSGRYINGVLGALGRSKQEG